MTNAEAIEILKTRRMCAAYVDSEYVDSVDIEAVDMAIAALEKQEGKKPIAVETNIYDQEEIHHGCTVQVLRNSVTGEVSVGWWKEKEDEE